MSRVSSKRFLKFLGFLILSFAVLAFPALHVSAAGGEDYIYIVEFADSTNGAVVVIDIGAPLVLAESRSNTGDARLSFSNGEGYTLTYLSEFIDGELAAWTTDNSLLDVVYTLDDGNLAAPVQYEEVTATYYNTSGELSTATTKITGAFTADDVPCLQVESIRDFRFSPGVLLNKSGKCVGLLYDNDKAMTILFDADAFVKGADNGDNPGGDGDTVIDNPGTDLPETPEPSPKPTPSPDEPEDEDTYVLIGYDGNGNEAFRFENTDGEFKLPDGDERKGYTFRGWSESEDGPVDYLAGERLEFSEAGTRTVYAVYEKNSMPIWIYAAAGGVALVLIVGIIILIATQKTPPPLPPDPGNGTFGYTEPIPDVPPYVEPPVPPVPPDDFSVRLMLRCTGGYQDGRTYPIGEGPIKIGRTADCVIRYPDGTPGVSHAHAVLFWRNGILMLQDTSSTDTYLKRIGKLAKNQPVQVNVGDVFYIGERKNRFEIMRG